MGPFTSAPKTFSPALQLSYLGRKAEAGKQKPHRSTSFPGGIKAELSHRDLTLTNGLIRKGSWKLR